MRAMKLDQIIAGLVSTSCCLAKSLDGFPDLRDRHLFRDGVLLAEFDRTRSDRHFIISFAFAAGMSQLNTGGSSALMDKLDDRGQALDLAIIPDAQIPRRYAPLRSNGGCFLDDQASAADCARTIVHAVEIQNLSAVITAVHAHRCHYYSIFKLKILKLICFKCLHEIYLFSYFYCLFATIWLIATIIA